MESDFEFLHKEVVPNYTILFPCPVEGDVSNTNVQKHMVSTRWCNLSIKYMYAVCIFIQMYIFVEGKVLDAKPGPHHTPLDYFQLVYKAFKQNR